MTEKEPIAHADTSSPKLNLHTVNTVIAQKISTKAGRPYNNFRRQLNGIFEYTTSMEEKMTLPLHSTAAFVHTSLYSAQKWFSKTLKQCICTKLHV